MAFFTVLHRVFTVLHRIFTVLHRQIRVRVVGTPDSYLGDGMFEPGHKQAIKRVLYVLLLSQSSYFEGHYN
jgi:hypothetical protein